MKGEKCLKMDEILGNIEECSSVLSSQIATVDHFGRELTI